MEGARKEMSEKHKQEGWATLGVDKVPKKASILHVKRLLHVASYHHHPDMEFLPSGRKSHNPYDYLAD